MERAGLVARRTDASDQRQTLVELTGAGRDLQHRLDAAMAEYVAATLDKMSEQDRKELARILPIWRELADEALADPALAGHPSAGSPTPAKGTTNLRQDGIHR